LGCAQLLWTRFVTRKFRVNVFDAEELVIGQGQQSLEFFRGQLDCYFGHVNTILPHFRYAVIHPEHAARPTWPAGGEGALRGESSRRLPLHGAQTAFRAENKDALRIRVTDGAEVQVDAVHLDDRPYLTPSAATTSSTSTTVFSGWLNESFRLAVPQTAKTLRP